MITQICDGEYLYTVSRRFESSKVTKAHCEPGRVRAPGGETIVRSMRALRNRAVVDSQFDGRPIYLFLGDAQGGKVKVRHYVDKATGVFLKTHIRRETDQSIFTYTLSQVDLDREYPDERFHYVPDPDLPLIDLTTQGRQTEPSPVGAEPGEP
jgi:hypothetical protein